MTLQITIHRAGDKLEVSVNGQSHSFQLYTRDTLCPDGYFDALPLLARYIEEHIAPAQLGAYLHRLSRYRSYKAAEARRRELEAQQS